MTEPTHIRCFKDDKRIATAIYLDRGHVCQVYPKRDLYESFADWRDSLTSNHMGLRFQEYIRSEPFYRALPPILGRVEKEIAGFFDSDFREFFIKVTQLTDNTVEVLSAAGDRWTVLRHGNFFKAPIVHKNGVIYNCCDSDYSAACSAFLWLLSILVSD